MRKASVDSIWKDLWHEHGPFVVHIFVAMILFFGLGYFLAAHMATIPKLEFFKLLNLVGLAFDGIGVLLLSSLFARHARYQAFVQGALYTYALAILTFGPFGIFAGVSEGLKTGSMGAASAIPLLSLSAVVFASALTLEYAVVGKRWAGRSGRFKAQLMGTFFLLDGFLLQFVGAYLDLRS